MVKKLRKEQKTNKSGCIDAQNILKFQNFSLCWSKLCARFVHTNQIGYMIKFKSYIVITLIVFLAAVHNINAQWQQVYNAGAVAFTSSGSNIFAGNVTGVLVSTNGGSNWSQTGLNNQNIYSLTVSGSNILAGGLGIFLSSNMGTNWTQTLSDHAVYSLASSPGYIFAGTDSGVYVSTNNGMNWTQSSLNNRIIYALAVTGSNVYAGADNGYGVYISTNNGSNWSQTSLNNYGVLSLYLNGNSIYAGLLGYGVQISTNYGANWSNSSLSHVVYSVVYTNNTIIAATHHGGVFVSTNEGSSWTAKNEGMAILNVRALFLYNGQMLAGNNHQGNAGMYRRPVGELAALQQISSSIPKEHTLKQNYPNPFNPVTNIEFSIPKSSFVKLAVFDITGRELETLVSQNMTPGTYKADWDASKYSSGIYFYTITTGGFTQTKKMILTK